MTNDKPFAFVIMPFDTDFDAVYDEIIKPALHNAGFEVDRADDIQHHGNILRQIIENIYRSTLIVADLTSANANVFYELGIAHKLGKPVIPITQRIDDVPFDLRSYRLLEYSSQLSGAEKARGSLYQSAKGLVDGTVAFGSPVSDFAPDASPSPQATPHPSLVDEEEDDRGFIDHYIAVNDGYSQITEILSSATIDINTLSQNVVDATKEFNRLGVNMSSSTPVAARNVARRLSERVSAFNSRLEVANAKYQVVAQETDNSLEAVMLFQAESLGEKDPQIEAQRNTLREYLGIATQARDSQLSFAETMGKLPKFERRLNREMRRGSEQVRIMAGNLDRTIASMTRALNAGS